MTFLRKKIKIVFLAFIVLGVYYPSIFAGFNLVDDYEVFGRLEDAASFDLAGLLQSAGSGYYRPLTTLTFFFDKAFWGLEPGFMHLENIILHTLNTILVFLIAEKVFTAVNVEKYELPLLSALLFALHPINTETVNWISGRFDLLAASFVLAASIFIQHGLEKRQNRYFVLSAFSLFVGCFAKESVLFFFPAAFFLVLFSRQERFDQFAQDSLPPSQRWRDVSPFVAAFTFYILYRLAASRSTDTGIVRVAKQMTLGVENNILDSVRIAIKVFGFYVKKLFIPMPLNFAIVSINDYYLWVGMGSLLIAVYFLRRRNVITDQFLVSLSLISPGIAVAFARVAWTPIAERYLYLSSAFFAIAFIGIIIKILQRFRRTTWITAAALAIIIGAASVTEERTMIWQDNANLYADTLKKSPEFKRLKNSLAQALKENGKIAEADELLTRAIKSNPGQVNLYINQADLRLGRGQSGEARTIIMQAFKDKTSANPEVLKMLARIDETRISKADSRAQQVLIAIELVQTYDALFMSTQDAFFLYRSGQLLLVMGKKQQAGEYFQRAYDFSREGAYFKDPSKKLASKLGATVQ